ncbi:MAG TPA: ectonucleotide pyrophosphatase/phosphodiesterase, partial [Gillisia sp.]|nr:ectonucleotide pyrophosphatase/phosphodiesterase [Gillisia sp.]
MKILLYLLFLLFIPASLVAQDKTEKSYVLLVSFDGFRHDYVEKYDAENFKKFIAEGSAAKSLIPSFPSKTFPNHYSIVTGMYPGNHGLVGNIFYDSIRNTTYSIGNREVVEDPFYYGGTPLWQLTQENGYKSASYFWVGSEAPVKGSYPDYYYRYNEEIPNKERIEQVMKWLELPEQERPRFISLYFSLVDSEGHATGPDSGELALSVKEADFLIGDLMEKLKEVDLPVDVIITSDHGMKQVEVKSSIDPDPILKEVPSEANIIRDQIISHVYLPKELVESTYKILKTKEANFRVYKKEEMPENLHYNYNYRIGDILLLADPGYIFNNKS